MNIPASYPGPAFQKIVRSSAATGMSLNPTTGWASLKEWHDTKFMQGSGFNSCYHWSPNGMPGFIYLDAPSPVVQVTVLCQRCFARVAMLSSIIGLGDDFTCNMCDTSPENRTFTDTIVALQKNITLIGQICDHCLSTRQSA